MTAPPSYSFTQSDRYNHNVNAYIVPTLQALNMYSPQAVELMHGTALAESGYDVLIQNEGGPALGYWQMEPKTHDDIWDNYLKYRPELSNVLYELLEGLSPDARYMIRNHAYACAMARLVYYRVPEPIPLTVADQAAYWKQYYNTTKGQGHVQQYLDAWRSVE